MSDTPRISLNQQLSAVLEVLDSRRAGYPKKVFAGKLRQAEADYRIAQIEAVCDTLVAALRDQKQPPYQERVRPWLTFCFGPELAVDTTERNHRFLEEALELTQATGCTRDEAHQIVDYVFGRDAGNADQEVGGVMNTLAALCLAHGLDMHEAGERELARVWQPEITAKIRAKQATKPKFSPLPGSAQPSMLDEQIDALLKEVSELPDTERSLWGQNERVLIEFCRRLGSALEKKRGAPSPSGEVR